MKDWTMLHAVERHPDILSGAWVFRGTRVPVTALFENVRDGATVDQFLEWIFPRAFQSRRIVALGRPQPEKPLASTRS